MIQEKNNIETDHSYLFCIFSRDFFIVMSITKIKQILNFFIIYIVVQSLQPGFTMKKLKSYFEQKHSTVRNHAELIYEGKMELCL